MKKSTILLALALCILAAAPLAADAQVDIGVNLPTWIGISYNGENVMEQIPIRLPLPDLMFNYFFEVGDFKLGVGARVWTIILATGAYPIVSAEYETERLLVNANIVGGVFGYVTVAPEVSGIETGRVFLPEVSALFRVTDWFAAGVGVLGVLVPELTDGFGYSVNLIGRFRVR
jgi:hypothetical protein